MFRGPPGEEMKTRLQAALDESSSNGTLFTGGHVAAVATVQLMTDTFETIKPRTICDAYDAALRDETPKAQILTMLWDTFGADTVKVMADGCRHLALLWESAWKEADGDHTIPDLTGSTQDALKALYNKRDFLPSFLLTQIGDHLNSLADGSTTSPAIHSRRSRGGRRRGGN